MLGSSDGKEYACSVADLGSIPGLGRSPREGKGYTLQYSDLKNSMDRGVWQGLFFPHGVERARQNRDLYTHTLQPQYNFSKYTVGMNVNWHSHHGKQQ